MADYTPYAPGINAARSVWDQGIAPLAKGVQGFLKGTAGLPGAVKDYAAETVQSEAGPTTKVMVDLLTLGQGMRQGIREDPLRAMAEMYPPVGFGSDVFETGRLLKQAQNAEESGELEKAQTLRELANTIVLMGMVPGGPPAKKTIEQKLKDMEEKRRKLKEETGLPYVPNKEPPLPEGRRIDLNEAELDLLERERRLQQATTASRKPLADDSGLSKKAQGYLKRLQTVDPTASIRRSSRWDDSARRDIPGWEATIHNKTQWLGDTWEDVDIWFTEGFEAADADFRVAETNRTLGLPEDAQTGRWVVDGYDPQGAAFTMEDGRVAAEKIKNRHRRTNYDELLKQGYDKESARELMTDTFRGVDLKAAGGIVTL